MKPKIRKILPNRPAAIGFLCPESIAAKELLSIAYEVKQPFSVDNQFSKESRRKKEKLHAEEMDEACKLEVEWISVVLARTLEKLRRRHKENANVDYQSQQYCCRAYQIQIVISSIPLRRLHDGRPERFWRLVQISPTIRRCR